MTCLAAEPPLVLPPPAPRWELVRATVFWTFVLSIIVSPAVLGVVILLHS